MNKVEQHWDSTTGQWEPQTNHDWIRNMNKRNMAKFLAEQFCHGYGEEQIYEWLGMEHKEDKNN